MARVRDKLTDPTVRTVQATPIYTDTNDGFWIMDVSAFMNGNELWIFVTPCNNVLDRVCALMHTSDPNQQISLIRSQGKERKFVFLHTTLPASVRIATTMLPLASLAPVPRWGFYQTQKDRLQTI